MRWFLITLCWLIWGLFHASQLRIDIPDISWATAMKYALPDAMLWALLTPVPVVMARRFPLQADRALAHGSLHLAMGLLVAVVHSLADALLNLLQAGWIGHSLDLADMFSHLFYYSFHINVILYATLVGIVHFQMRAARLRQQERQAVELRAQLSEARLEALRMQLRPHFLFNVLNTISGLMEQDPKTGQKIVRQLGDLLRRSLDTRGQREIPLRDEVEFVRSYLEIEQVRFRERLQTAIDMEPGALDCPVPPFILQPIVENAIRHGIAPLPGGGRVEVKGVLHNGRLELQVRDNGAGLPPEMISPAGEESGPPTAGIGIANTRARLQELYGDDHAFRLEPLPEGGLLVTLSLPGERPANPGRRVAT